MSFQLKNYKKLEDWKKSKKTIVFTNGCFDLLHKGHIDLLTLASKYGDKLIVGINSDESVKKLKGEDRPVENQRTRKKNLLNIKYVDDVYVFEESTPLNVIKSICPDVLVKGADYTVPEIVGAKFVLSNGGKVRTVPLTPGFSTTKSIEKMAK
tara:strand:- start:384 stop:842 length:459 start_codon:yes stop_codon:yes gene_type:complete